MRAIQQTAALIAEGRGIFDISSIEAQQLQLAWHVVGVLKGGVGVKRGVRDRPPAEEQPGTHTFANTQFSEG